ncbi:antirestriction protein [Xenorhabdus siamensis]|uniref:antirestriction protein n=1 Tax=Xenorhabdus siamensis TaxID=3136254 RepID=UPI0030F38EC7
MWYICSPLEADIIFFVDDEGYLIHPGMTPATQRGIRFPSGKVFSVVFKESTMQQNKTRTTVHAVPASELSPFADVFPRSSPLELILLEHTVIKAAVTLCEDYRCDTWQCRKVSDNIAYAVPTRADTYGVKIETTDFNGEVSADTFGLMVTLSVLGYLTALMKQDEVAERFCDLRAYALQHPQAQCIRAALGLAGA